MSVRIVAGEFKGRRIQVERATGLRPTGDRARETLFNWLQGQISGRRCLDLFAGSGALGLEALSRGAEYVLALERQVQIARALKLRKQTWDLGAAYEVQQVDAVNWLKQVPKTVMPFDLIFFDPPFSSNLLLQSLEQYRASHLFHATAMLYIERAQQQQLPSWCQPYKEQQLGACSIGLYRLQP